MKILFWLNKKNNLKRGAQKKPDTLFNNLNKKEQDEVLKKGAEDFSVKFTKLVDKLSNE